MKLYSLETQIFITNLNRKFSLLWRERSWEKRKEAERSLKNHFVSLTALNYLVFIKNSGEPVVAHSFMNLYKHWLELSWRQNTLEQISEFHQLLKDSGRAFHSLDFRVLISKATKLCSFPVRKRIWSPTLSLS